MSESFATLFEESLKTTEMRPGTLVTGMVLDIQNDYVIIDAGLKSEAVVPVEQFKNALGELEVTVGDEVEVALEVVENSYGETRLSRDKAKKAKVWKELDAAFESNENITGVITGQVRGGFTVEIESLRAFLPGSLVDIRPLRDISHLENKPLEFKVIKIDPKRNNIVVSRRAVIESETQGEREELFNKLAEGQEMMGIVKNITDFGAFIDLGGIDGLLHITDMSWSRIKHPSDVMTVGDEIKVKIIKFDREKGRISLGIKQLGDDPWQSVADEFTLGKVVKGLVTNIADYGCFVQLKEGVEGLVHSSEMDWSNKNVVPSKYVQPGQEVEVMVLEVDTDRHRISLGMKQCTVNPWQAFAEKHQKGERLTGTIRSITDFGLFIGLDGGIDGLIHVSDITWSQNADEIIKQYTKGQEVEAVLLSVDTDRERIALGIKQIEDNPFANYIELNEKGTTVTGKVTEVEPQGAKIELADDITGYLRASDIAEERVEDATTELKVGDEVEAVIVSIDRKKSMVNLSIRALSDPSKFASKGKSSEEKTTTIGDLIKEKMSK